jgi:lipid-binding SYLF domain-containing protein
MKNVIMALLLFGLAATTFADPKGDLDDRVRKLMAQFDSLQANAEARIPAAKLKQAKGVVIMDRTKGGFVVGYERGVGIAMVKDKDKNKWGAFTFMESNEGSLGAQIGGKSTFCVILLMDDSARDRLIQSKVTFGGEAGGTGGSTSGGVDENFSKEPPVLVFGESKGLYGGAAVKGGTVDADDKANKEYYGKLYSIKEILFEKKVPPSETAVEFANKLEAATKEQK